MSKYIDGIVKNIKEFPEDWVDTGFGIRKGNIRIRDYGNGDILTILSICYVEIDGKRIPNIGLESMKLERAVRWWYKNIPLHHLINPL